MTIENDTIPQPAEAAHLIKSDPDVGSHVDKEKITFPSESRLTRYVSEVDAIAGAVGQLTEQEVAQGGLARREDGSLVYDRGSLIQQEVDQIDAYLDALENNKPVGRVLEQEKPFFRHMLAELLKKRREALLSGEDTSIDDLLDSSEYQLGNSTLSPALKEKFKAAAELFKTYAQKEMIRSVVSQQVETIPFTSIRLINGEEVVFDRSNLFDERSPIGNHGKLDWMYTVSPNGQAELIICSQYGIDSVFIGDYPNTQAFVNAGKFSIRVDSSEPVARKTDDLVVTLSQGGSPIRPLFSRVRVIRTAMSLDKEFENYLKEEEEKQRQASIQHQPYSAPPPSAGGYGNSSTPQQRYVSSG